MQFQPSLSEDEMNINAAHLDSAEKTSKFGLNMNETASIRKLGLCYFLVSIHMELVSCFKATPLLSLKETLTDPPKTNSVINICSELCSLLYQDKFCIFGMY